MDARCTKNEITILWFFRSRFLYLVSCILDLGSWILNLGSWILDLGSKNHCCSDSGEQQIGLVTSTSRLCDLHRVYFELKAVNFFGLPSSFCRGTRERTTTSGLHCTLKHGYKWFVAAVETGDKR